MKYNHDLSLNGAKDEEIALLLDQNKEIIKSIIEKIPYDSSHIVNSLIENYDRLISKYCKYSFLLGFTRAIYNEKD